jgi:hypothetical protein
MSGGVGRADRAGAGGDWEVGGPAGVGAGGGAEGATEGQAGTTDAATVRARPRSSGIDASILAARLAGSPADADADDWQVTRPPLEPAPTAPAPAAPPVTQLPDLSHLPPAGQAAEWVRLAAGEDPDLADAARERLLSLGAAGMDAAVAAWPSLGAAGRRALLPLLGSEAGAAHPGASALLLEASGDKDPRVASRAAQFLSLAAQAEGAPPSFRAEAARRLAASAAGHADPVAREEAAKHLFALVRARPGEPAVLETLSTLAKVPDGRVARWAAEAYGDPEVAAVVNGDADLQARALADLRTLEKTVSHAFSDAVYGAMGRIASKPARERLLEVATGPNASARAAAMAGLAHDPSTADALIQAALSDRSDIVREAATAALHGLADAATTEGARADLYARLRAASGKAEGPAKEALDATAAEVAKRLGGDHPAFSLDRLEALTKAYEAKPLDAAALSKALAYASPAALKAFEAQLARDGKKLDEVLVLLREKDPEGYAGVLESFTELANLRHTGAKPGKELDRYRDVLVAHLKAHPEAVDDYARRNLEPRGNRYYPDPRVATVEVLSALDDDKARAALVRHGTQADEGTREAIHAALAKRPPAEVQRIAGARMKDASLPEADRDFAARVLVRSGGPEGKRMAGAHWGAIAKTRVGELSRYVDARKGGVESMRRELNDLHRLRLLHQYGHGKLTPEAFASLERDIARTQDALWRVAAETEKRAAAVEAMLSDPDIAAGIAALPPDEAKKIVSDGVRSMVGTASGQRFFESAVAPAIADPAAGGLVVELLKGADPFKDLAAEVVGHFAPQVAARGEAFASLAMRRMAGKGGQALSKADFEAVEKALLVLGDEKASEAAKAAARSTLDAKGIKGSFLEKLGGAWSGIQLAIGLQELVKDPSFKNALSAADNAAGFAEAVSKIVEKSPSLSKHWKSAAAFGKVAGAAAGVFQFGASTLEMYESAGRKDLGGMIGDLAQAGGGLFLAAGVAFPPFAVVGVILTAGGTVGKWIWGDSEEEKRLKSLADKYGYDYEG